MQQILIDNVYIGPKKRCISHNINFDEKNITMFCKSLPLLNLFLKEWQTLMSFYENVFKAFIIIINESTYWNWYDLHSNQVYFETTLPW